MSIVYTAGRPITSEQFVDLLNRSTLGERRPVDNPECIKSMVDNADLTVTAWEGETLVGIARSVTDFAFCCYLSDLAVCRDLQHQGIGKALIAHTKDQLPDSCKLILLAAPAATEYYPKIGFDKHPSAWIMDARKPLP